MNSNQENTNLETLAGDVYNTCINRTVNKAFHKLNPGQEIYRLLYPKGISYGFFLNIESDQKPYNISAVSILAEIFFLLNKERINNQTVFINSFSVFFEELKLKTESGPNYKNLIFYKIFHDGYEPVDEKTTNHLELLISILTFYCILSNADFNPHEIESIIVKELRNIINEKRYASQELDKYELKLLKYYEKSLDEHEEESPGIVNYEITGDILNNWLVKRCLLDIACLLVVSDKKTTEKEDLFIRNFSLKYNIPSPEYDEYLISAEGFLIENFEKIKDIISLNQNLAIKDRYIDRVTKYLNQNGKRLQNELKESKELITLLNKATKEPLTEEEKIKVKTQLLDILKTLPLFTLVALPGSFITIPLLLKIIPKHILFPSSFIDEKNKEKK